MSNSLGRKSAELRLVGLVGLFFIVAVLPGVIGWLIANRLGISGAIGVLAPYVSLFLLAALAYLLGVIVEAIAAFILFLPLVYILVLVLQSVLGAFRLSSYAGADDFFLRNLDGALYGAGIAALMMLKSGRGDFGEIFLAGLSLRLPLAFMIAGVADVPDGLAARIVLGSFWGLAFAGGAVLVTTLVDKEPLKESWIPLSFVVMGLLFFLIFLGFLNVADDQGVRLAVFQTVPAATVASVGTYLVALAIVNMRQLPIRQIQRWFRQSDWR